MQVDINLTENIIMSDTVKFGRKFVFSDNLSITDNLYIKSTYKINLQDNILIEDNISNNTNLVLFFEEQINISEELVVNIGTIQRLLDSIMINDYIYESVPNEYKLTNNKDTFNVNLKLNAFTKYDNFSFKSGVKHNGKYLICNENGIYENTGNIDEDKNIQASFKTGLIRFGGNLQSRIDKAFLAIKNDGKMNIKLIGSDGKEFIYTLVETSQTIKDKQVKFGKGNGVGGARKCSYFQFEIDNNGSTDFELDNLAVYKLIVSQITN